MGTPVTLSAAGTSDPDGNKVKYTWYQEAASAISKPARPEEAIGERGEDKLEALPKVRIEGRHGQEATLIPQSAGIAHVILAVEEPRLTSYRREMLNIEN